MRPRAGRASSEVVRGQAAALPWVEGRNNNNGGSKARQFVNAKDSICSRIHLILNLHSIRIDFVRFALAFL